MGKKVIDVGIDLMPDQGYAELFGNGDGDYIEIGDSGAMKNRFPSRQIETGKSDEIDFSNFAGVRAKIFGVDSDLYGDFDRQIDLEEGGFGAGGRVHDGFQIVEESRLNRWKRAGRIPRTVKNADQFLDWRIGRKKRQPGSVVLGEVLSRRKTDAIVRSLKPDYQRRIK